MSNELQALLERAKSIKMTPEQFREQRRSFVYGNTHIENAIITREMVSEAEKKIDKESEESNERR